MSTELQQKLTSLSLIERGLVHLSSGKGHGPAAEGYDFFAGIIGLGTMALFGGAMMSFPMPETGFGLAGRILGIFIPVVGSLIIYREFVKSALANKPTWAQVIADELAAYKPVEQESWAWLHEQAGEGTAVDIDALQVWLSVEQNAVRKLTEVPKPKVLVELRSARQCDSSSAD